LVTPYFNERDSSPKKENSVISYSCSSKPVWVSFFCLTKKKKKIFWRMLVTSWPVSSIVGKKYYRNQWLLSTVWFCKISSFVLGRRMKFIHVGWVNYDTNLITTPPDFNDDFDDDSYIVQHRFCLWAQYWIALVRSRKLLMSVTKNVPDFTHHISLRWTTQRVDFPWTQMLDEQGNFVPLFDTEEERLCIYYLMHENIFFFVLLQ